MSESQADATKFVVNHQGLTECALRLQAYAKLLLVSKSAGEFRQWRTMIQGVTHTIDAIADDVIENTFAAALSAAERCSELPPAANAVSPAVDEPESPSAQDDLDLRDRTVGARAAGEGRP